jgi:hypothetical protein
LYTKDSIKNSHVTYIVDPSDSFRRVIVNRDYVSSKCAIDFFVAGYKYYDGKDIIEFLGKNEPIELVREYFNPYDTFAVAAYTRDFVKLGYIPKIISSLIAYRLEEGKSVRALIKKISNRDSDYTKIELRAILPIDVQKKILS